MEASLQQQSCLSIIAFLVWFLFMYLDMLHMLSVNFNSNSSFQVLILGDYITVATNIFTTRNRNAVYWSYTALQWPVASTWANSCKLLQMVSVNGKCEW